MSSSSRVGSWVLVVLAAAACGSENSGSEPRGETFGPKVTVPQCSVDADCEQLVCDGTLGPCQRLACDVGECVLVAVEAGVACDDGLFCTKGEVCDGKGTCSGGASPCRELIPGIPICNEALKTCETCDDGRPLVDGECRCPFWNCVGVGGARWCSQQDDSEENFVACWYDGVTVP